MNREMKQMVSCVFPGSFDPITSGHLDLIRRASCLFDRVTVVVMINIHKDGLIPVEQRIKMIQTACSDLPNVSVDRWDGLLADYLSVNHEKIIVRGLRNTLEFEQEQASSIANRMLNESAETLFLPSDPELSAVSSSAVREIASFGGDISRFVPGVLLKEIESFLSKKNKNKR